MKRCIIFICIFFFVLPILAKNKAILIGVSDYPQESGWCKLSSVHDVELLKTKFPTTWEISTLIDREANYKGIITTLYNIAQCAFSGDTVFIHFSGHGQQMVPINSDEADSLEVDKLDEAFVPIDANKEWSQAYDGSKHLRDDELSHLVNLIRNRIGKNGFVIVTLDACHSDNMDRGDCDSTSVVYRGTSDIFGEVVTPKDIECRFYRDTTLIELSNNANVVYISACQSHSQNKEINIEGVGYGSLSYAIGNALDPFNLSDIKGFIDNIVLTMNEYAKYQTPGIRSSFNYSMPQYENNITSNITQSTINTTSHKILFPIVLLVLIITVLSILKTQIR